MSDIHGCLPEFEAALGLVLEHLEEPDTMLLLLGDYVHGGDYGYRVLDRIMNLQYESGSMVMTCFKSDCLLEDADGWRDECWRMIRERSNCWM